MSATPEQNPEAEAERLEAATDQAIAACGGDMRGTVRALIIANEFLQAEMDANVSRGYMRGVYHGRFKCYNG